MDEFDYKEAFFVLKRAYEDLLEKNDVLLTQNLKLEKELQVYQMLDKARRLHHDS